MIPPLVDDPLASLVLLWVCSILPYLWPSPPGGRLQRPAASIQPTPRRGTAPTPFAGLTHKPHCAWGEPETTQSTLAPPVRPDPMPPRHRRPRTVDTAMHFCPHSTCDYRGWLGLNSLRANGHPGGGPWRHGLGCQGYCPEHHGTIFHGKPASVELSGRVLACLAEG